MGTTVKDDYINGSDLLLNVGGKAIGHCTTHTTTFNSDTKERAVKPVASASKTSGSGRARALQVYPFRSRPTVCVCTQSQRTASRRSLRRGARDRVSKSRLSTVARTMPRILRVSSLSQVWKKSPWHRMTPHTP